MASLDQKLDLWKNKLLDLSKRNRLINYRETKRSSLRIDIPGIYDLWQSFVIQEKPLQFDYIDDDIMDGDIQDKKESTKRTVITNQSIRDQQKTLRNLRSKEKLAQEEQGVNILHLSFSFLRWKESKASEQLLISPLILVPVSLKIASIASPFVMTLREDEIVVNPTLQYKLYNDFGISFPEFDENESIETYLSVIERIVAPNQWEVVTDVGLSLFSYLKINMYGDICRHGDRIMQHPVIKALNGDAASIKGSVDSISNMDFDRDVKPSEVFQVVDADSSQQEAILYAKSGASFVLQGPPGTGKSQTITNIIAESLADGKRVLFVSEKMAALEVVQRRLAQTGLDTFCMVLHGYKAKKKDVLNQLAEVMDMATRKADLSNDAFQKLDMLMECRQQLNDYAEQLFQKVQPLNISIYQANGFIAKLESFPNVIFQIDKVRDATQENMNRWINLLHRYSEIMGNYSDDYLKNPWHDSTVKYISNEFRYDVDAKLGNVLVHIPQITKVLTDISADIALERVHSYNGLQETARILDISMRSPKVPLTWIWRRSILPIFDEIEQNQQTQKQYAEQQDRLAQIYKDIMAWEPSIQFDAFSGLSSKDEIDKHRKYIEHLIASNEIYKHWDTYNSLNVVSNALDEAASLVYSYTSKKEQLLKVFESEIFDIDYKALQARFKAECTNALRAINKNYRADKRQIQGLYRELVKKVSDQEILATLASLREIDETKQTLDAKAGLLIDYFKTSYQGETTDFASIHHELSVFRKIQEARIALEALNKQAEDIIINDSIMQRRYDFLYKGINTNWDEVKSSFLWAKEFREAVEQYQLPKEYVESICLNESIIGKCNEYSSSLVKQITEITNDLTWFFGLFTNQEEMKNTYFPIIFARMQECQNGLSLLEQWIDLNTVRETCRHEGLGGYLEQLTKMHETPNTIVPIFQKRFYRLWLDAFIQNYPAVMNFRRLSQESLVSKFSALDTLQFDIAKARIRKNLIDQLPSMDRFSSGGVDEVTILKRELNKQKRIKPIRKLFREIPNLLLTLKPCLMMSPLSVSMFLEADSYDFDIVIFDEASQVCTEDAIGAICRGEQVVIAGDSKQLPPTNFFSATTSDSEFDDEDDIDKDDDIDAYDSILDEASLLPEKTLLWHYRSRNEYLIAFSNAKIYRNNLITFPSSVENNPDNGVEYVYVSNGIYNRGGKRGNPIEAEKVAELVFDHFKRYPNRTLGVVAFGAVQQQAIEGAVRSLRKKKPQYEIFFSEDKNEPFFIKNLESVQGDERDTIIFSIGYARDQNGKMLMNFGPLSRTGGERRLNVAITRAKYNVKLIGSILPTDINIDSLRSDGPKLLRSYIEFAQHGISSLTNEISETDIAEHDSPFEEAVYNFLDRKGYKLGTQVGCSGYRIDIAVKHPTISGKYILGIECDGASYHSARTARERDRLRQSVLESMGWEIYRIWSTDWIKDTVSEGKRLITAIENAINSYQEETPTIMQVEPESSIQKEVTFLDISEKAAEKNDNDNPYGFDRYKNTEISNVQRGNDQLQYLADIIMTVVQNEYPIHTEYLCKKLAYLLGNQKATVKVRNSVNYAISERLGKQVIIKDNFLFPVKYERIKPRMPSAEDIRPIEHISKEELMEAMLIIARVCIGITPDSLFCETARAYGFNRTGAKIQKALKVAYDELISTECANEVEGKVVVK